MEKNDPQSCDTFVVMKDMTANGLNIFGKNSDRPQNEVQEVVYEGKKTYPKESQLQCTYIHIPQVEETYEVILSKPSWMWGAEMGSNEFGVTIGNEAIWSIVEADLKERLLGMDLLRLALERSKTAHEALKTITTLLETYGQGGPCSDTNTTMAYHNSYLIVDPTECWVLETVDRMWAAERITTGFRNISNCLSIETKIDMKSEGLEEKAQDMGLYNGTTPFNFRQVFDDSSDRSRYICGQQHLNKLSSNGNFKYTDMFEVLRSKTIGRSNKDGHPTSGSMVSVLSNDLHASPSVHWLTGTPDPLNSIFKPFIFGPDVSISSHIQSPTIPESDDPAKMKPRFSAHVCRAHALYKIHVQNLTYDHKMDDLRDKKHKLELQLNTQVDQILSTWLTSKENYLRLFEKAVLDEMQIYD